MGRLGPGIPSLALEKATLEVVEGQGVPMSLKFQYNPEQFSFEKAAQWSRPQANENDSTPPPTYLSTDPGTLTMDIFFDTFSLPFGDVTEDVRTLFTWTKPCPDMVPKKPPILAFRWGSSQVLSDFTGFLQRVTANYTMFRMDGAPVRATCNITLSEVPNPRARQNPTSGGQSGLRSHVLVEGETLHSLAWSEYKQASHWRGIAAFNNIDDPTRVEPGTRLLLPAARDAARMS
jgi:contractile injection system tube protein